MNIQMLQHLFMPYHVHTYPKFCGTKFIIVNIVFAVHFTLKAILPVIDVD